MVTFQLVVCAFLLWFTRDRGPITVTPGLADSTTSEAAASPSVAPLPSNGGAFPAALADPSNEREAEDYWDEKIDDAILDFADKDDVVRQRLFAIAADDKVPANSRIRALEHGLNLLDDEHYREALPFLLEGQATDEMREAVFFDLQGRGDPLKLSACVEIIKRRDHPFTTQAGELLQFFTREDLGSDWQAWNQAVDRYLHNAVAKADES